MRPHEAVLLALRDTPTRLADAWRDPVRWRNSISRIAEGWVGGALAAWLAGGGAWSPLIGLAAPAAEFAVYEYVLEPLGLTGHYWERGPRWNERFVRP